MAAAMMTGPSWPRADGYFPDDGRDRARPDADAGRDAIAEMAGLLRDTGSSVLAAGAILAAITLGIALEVAFSGRVLRPGPAGVASGLLLCAMLCCWLRAVSLLALSGRPVLDALGELRWRTGAPADPRPRWLTLPPVDAAPEEWSVMRAHLLLAAARLGRERAQHTVTWALVTAACFAVWTVALLAGL
jgi:hypothetical protein